MEQGANIHINKEEALKLAAEFGYFKIVKYLVEQGADIYIGNEYSLMLVSYNGYLEIVQYLVEKVANIYANDFAFKYASANNHLDIVRYFLYDCKMQIKEEIYDWLKEKNKIKSLEIIEKRDLLFQLDKDINQKDSVDNFSNKIKI